MQPRPTADPLRSDDDHQADDRARDLENRPHEDAWDEEPPSNQWVQWVGLIGGAVLFVIMRLLPAPDGLEPEAWATAAIGVLMAVWWMTEALPIAATSLLPIVLLPLLEARPIGEATAPYANPLIFLFLGGFVIALAMERWGLHRRIALGVIRAIGTKPPLIVLGFLLSAAFLSMWVSNTATAVMMLPIGTSIVALAKRSGGGTLVEAPAFGTALMLAIAYGCSIGGLGTLIGTPTNAVLAGFVNQTYGFDIGFAQWLLVGVPLMAVGLPVVYLVLTRIAFPIKLKTLPGGRELIRSELSRLGPISWPETMVLCVFGAVALLWIFRPLVASAFPDIHDAVIAMAGALMMFIIPVDVRRGRFLLTWEEAERLPWGVLLIFGGGLSLASAISDTGLAAWIGESLSAVGALPVVVLVLVVVLVIVFLTELTSNVATAAAFLPIMASVAVGIGENPLLLAVPAVIASSCAFMLPVATPPNAIVYGSGEVTIQQMMRGGFWLNILFIGIVTALALLLVPLVFDVTFGVVPEWATP